MADVVRVSEAAGLRRLSGRATRSIAIPAMVLSSTVDIVVAKDVMTAPSQVTKVRMTHIPNATTAKRGR